MSLSTLARKKQDISLNLIESMEYYNSVQQDEAREAIKKINLAASELEIDWILKSIAHLDLETRGDWNEDI